MTISLRVGPTAGGGWCVTEGDDGKDLVYVYEPVGVAATPAA